MHSSLTLISGYNQDKKVEKRHLYAGDRREDYNLDFENLKIWLKYLLIVHTVHRTVSLHSLDPWSAALSLTSQPLDSKPAEILEQGSARAITTHFCVLQGKTTAQIHSKHALNSKKVLMLLTLFSLWSCSKAHYNKQEMK